MYKVGKCLLLDLLKQRDMTQKQLADRLGVSKQFIYAVTNNKRVLSLEAAINVARILECGVEDLYIVEVSSE